MKKRVFATFVSILMIFVVAGCSNSGNSNQTSTNGKGNRGNFQKPDVYGEVSAINGNTITLKLMKIPQMNRPKGQVRGSGSGNMGVRNGASGNGNWSKNGSQGRGGMGARTYTGEEKNITIPDGVSMTTMTRGTNGVEQSDITLDQITTGSTLSIYYENDGKTIKNIRVQKPWIGNGQTGTAGS